MPQDVVEEIAARLNGSAVEMAQCLGHHYGDGTLIALAEDEEALIAQAELLGLALDGTLTELGSTFWHRYANP